MIRPVGTARVSSDENELEVRSRMRRTDPRSIHVRWLLLYIAHPSA